MRPKIKVTTWSRIDPISKNELPLFPAASIGSLSFQGSGEPPARGRSAGDYWLKPDGVMIVWTGDSWQSINKPTPMVHVPEIVERKIQIQVPSSHWSDGQRRAQVTTKDHRVPGKGWIVHEIMPVSFANVNAVATKIEAKLLKEPVVISSMDQLIEFYGTPDVEQASLDNYVAATKLRGATSSIWHLDEVGFFDSLGPKLDALGISRSLLTGDNYHWSAAQQLREAQNEIQDELSANIQKSIDDYTTELSNQLIYCGVGSSKI